MSLQAKLEELYDSFSREPLRSMFADDDARQQHLQRMAQQILESFVAAPPPAGQVDDAAQQANLAVINLIRQNQEDAVIPWARSRRIYDMVQATHTTRSADAQKQQFLDAAKTQSVPMWTAIFATYVLYSNAEQRSAFMSFLFMGQANSAPQHDRGSPVSAMRLSPRSVPRDHRENDSPVFSRQMRSLTPSTSASFRSVPAPPLSPAQAPPRPLVSRLTLASRNQDSVHTSQKLVVVTLSCLFSRCLTGRMGANE
eukprot:PhM_4_TR18436/c3_g2_i3/m.28829